MLNKLEKNILKRKLLYFHEIFFTFIKNLIYYLFNNNFKKKLLYSFHYQYKIYNLLHYNKSQIRNICVLTFRSKSNYRMFNISRLQIRHLGLSGYIPGLRKSTW